MTWNWQQRDWPRFKYDTAALAALEDKFLHRSGILLGAYKHIRDDDKQVLTISLISEEALKTSEIEGEYLNRDSLQSSVRRQFGLQTDNGTISPAEQGIAEMMVDLYRHFNTPLTERLLFAWHRMIMAGRRDVGDVGRYRTHEEPMQVVSGSPQAAKVHFEAPPSARMADEMRRFIKWYKAVSADGVDQLPAFSLTGTPVL